MRTWGGERNYWLAAGNAPTLITKSSSHIPKKSEKGKWCLSLSYLPWGPSMQHHPRLAAACTCNGTSEVGFTLRRKETKKNNKQNNCKGKKKKKQETQNDRLIRLGRLPASLLLTGSCGRCYGQQLPFAYDYTPPQSGGGHTHEHRRRTSF